MCRGLRLGRGGCGGIRLACVWPKARYERRLDLPKYSSKMREVAAIDSCNSLDLDPNYASIVRLGDDIDLATCVRSVVIETYAEIVSESGRLADQLIDRECLQECTGADRGRLGKLTRGRPHQIGSQSCIDQVAFWMRGSSSTCRI